MPCGRGRVRTRVAGAGRLAATGPVAPELNPTRRPTTVTTPTARGVHQAGVDRTFRVFVMM